MAELVSERARRGSGAAHPRRLWSAVRPRAPCGPDRVRRTRRCPGFAVVKQLEGSATSDFGAPDAIPSSDTRPLDDAELRRFQALLEASWQAFDAAVQAATGKNLRKGPRGGGRDLDGIVRHMLRADRSYLARLAWKWEKREAEDLSEELGRTRQAVRHALAAATRGAVPARGPRSVIIWTLRYFVRRVAWHVLNHAWEIEDRVGDAHNDT